MNQQVMLRKLKKMQEEMLQTQKEIEETVFTASAGGVVTIEMYGTKELKAVKIDEGFEAEGKEDCEMLSDMIVAASKEACKQIRSEEHTSELQSL